MGDTHIRWSSRRVRPKATFSALLLTAAAGCTSGAEYDTALDCSEPGTLESPGCLETEDEKWSVKAAIVFVRTSPDRTELQAAFSVASLLNCGAESITVTATARWYAAQCNEAKLWGEDLVVSYDDAGGGGAKHSVASIDWGTLQGADRSALLAARDDSIRYRDCYEIRRGGFDDTYLWDTIDLTDGKVHLDAIDRDEATLDFDFDGARGRITASVCTVDGTEW